MVKTVTHLITDCVSNDQGELFIAKRTIKILMAMSLDVKILSADWLTQCLRSKEVLAEGDFLAKGIIINDHFYPFGTNRNIQKLFHKMKFFIQRGGSNPMIKRKKLLRLILNCGGIITDTVNDATFIISMTDKTSDDTKSSDAISYLFVLDCVTLNELRKTDNYR
jgi:hypothetical protein